MDSNSSLSTKSTGRGVKYPLWVSDTKKRANDFAYAKEYMDYFDLTNELNEDRLRKINENFEIHSGRWSAIKNMNPDISLTLGSEQIDLGTGKLNHYPIIDRVSKSVVSDIIIRPLIPVIRDNSSKARNHRERVQLERVKEYFQTTEIQPRLEQITATLDAQNGVQDPQALSPDQQEQRQSQIQSSLKEATPEEIFSAMQKMRTPDELVATALLKEGMRYTKMKSKFDIGAENAVVTAEEYYRMGIVNGMPHFEALNPKWVVWGGSEHVEYVEDGQFAKYVQYLTPEDAITKYSHQLSANDIKKLSTLYSPIPGNGNRTGYTSDTGTTGIERRVVDIVADNPHLQDEIDLRSAEGQERYKNLLSSISHPIRTGYGIKETYITWMWIRKAKFVYRVVNGKLEILIRDEHYVKDPFAGDVKVVEKALPQAWHGVKLGDEFYLNVEPIPQQYNNPEDPFDVKLSIFGGRYNTYQNNVRNASLVDLGKPWQFRYNVLIKKMEEHQATDIGKVLLGTTTMIPKTWTWGQWYRSLFKAKTAIVSNHREGINNLDGSFFRSIDLGRTVDIENDIRQLEYIENKIITSMYYSPQKIGEISQYATNSNTAAAIQGVDRQMYRFHNRNREIKERTLTAFMHLCLFAYRNNEQVKHIVLSDFLRVHYELNFNTTSASKFTLHVVDDFRESERLEQMRSLALTFLQNGMTAGQLSAIMNAESMTEMQTLLEDIDREVQRAKDDEFKKNEALLQRQRETAEAQLQLQQEFLRAEANRERQVKVRLAEINSLQLENAVDVNRNKVNDSLEKTLVQIQSDEKMKMLDLKHDEKMKNKQFELEEKKIKKTKA